MNLRLGLTNQDLEDLEFSIYLSTLHWSTTVLFNKHIMNVIFCKEYTTFLSKFFLSTFFLEIHNRNWNTLGRFPSAT